MSPLRNAPEELGNKIFRLLTAAAVGGKRSDGELFSRSTAESKVPYVALAELNHGFFPIESARFLKTDRLRRRVTLILTPIVGRRNHIFFGHVILSVASYVHALGFGPASGPSFDRPRLRLAYRTQGYFCLARKKEIEARQGRVVCSVDNLSALEAFHTRLIFGYPG